MNDAVPCYSTHTYYVIKYRMANGLEIIIHNYLVHNTRYKRCETITLADEFRVWNNGRGDVFASVACDVSARRGR